MAESKYAKDQESRALAKPKNKVDALRRFMSERADELARVMPRVNGLSVDRLTRLAVAAYSKDESLLKCTPASVFLAIHEACSLGLDPVTPSLGHAYLVPFKGVATFMLGYKGMMTLAHRSGFVARTYAGIVYSDEMDRFQCDPPRGHIRHPWKPDVNQVDSEIVAAYGVVYLKDDPMPVLRILNRAEIEDRRKRSQMGGKGRGPWATDYAAMARKSALRALYSMGVIPLGSDTLAAIHNDAVRDGVMEEDIVPIDAEVTETEAEDPVPPGAVLMDDGNYVTADMVSEEAWKELTGSKGEG